MKKERINATQLELFNFDQKEMERLEKQKNKKEKIIKQTKEKQAKENEYTNQKKYFNEALKKTKNYLSWGRISPKSKKTNYFSPLPTIFFSEDVHERECWKYKLWYKKKCLKSNIHIKGKERIFEIRWTLPLFEEAMGYIADKHMIYPSFEDFQKRNFIDFEGNNSMYEDLIYGCRDLLDPEVNDDDYFLNGVEFFIKNPFWTFDTTFRDIKSVKPEYLESMSFSQEKNVLLFQWKLPDEISRIHLLDDDEFDACFKYWLQ